MNLRKDENDIKLSKEDAFKRILSMSSVNISSSDKEKIINKLIREHPVLFLELIDGDLDVVERDGDWMREVRRLCAAGHVIQAIKEYRAHAGCGLKEAKDAVDALPERIEYRRAQERRSRESIPF